MCSLQKNSMAHFIAICALLPWSRMELVIFLRYASILASFLLQKPMFLKCFYFHCITGPCKLLWGGVGLTSAPSFYRYSPHGSCSSQRCSRSQQVSIKPQAFFSPTEDGHLGGNLTLSWELNPVVTESLGLPSRAQCFLCSDPKYPWILLQGIVWSSLCILWVSACCLNGVQVGIHREAWDLGRSWKISFWEVFWS